MSTSHSTRALGDPLRISRPIFVSNLASGGAWLLLPVALGAWPLSVIGALYVLAASLFLAVVYADRSLSTKQEALAWIAPWLGAVALWSIIVGALEFQNGTSESTFAIYPGVVVGTLCFIVWQILALAIRQFLAWQSKR